MHNLDGLLFKARPWLFASLAGALVAICACPDTALADDWIIGEARAAQPPATLPSPPILQFQIPDQPLETALESYGATTGLQILYDSRLATDRHSPGVKGSFDTDMALIKLLEGTGLAPVHTYHNVITLILAPRAGQYMMTTPSTSRPALMLNTLHVDAQPAERHTLYATTVRYAVLAALQSDRDVRQGNYNIDVNVWLALNGTVQRIELLAPTGNGHVDRAISVAIRRIAIGQAPPTDLPQPVHVNICAKSHG